jgi:hypothetical protein
MSNFGFWSDERNRRVIFTMAGTITIETWAATVARQINQGLWRYGTLYDFCRAEAFPALNELPEMTKQVGELQRERGVRGPVAIVVPVRVFSEYRRQFRNYADAVPYAFEVFTDAAMAEAWLDGADDRTMKVR